MSWIVLVFSYCLVGVGAARECHARRKWSGFPSKDLRKVEDVARFTTAFLFWPLNALIALGSRIYR